MRRLLMLSVIMLVLAACGASGNSSDSEIVPVTATAADTDSSADSDPTAAPAADSDTAESTPEAAAGYDPATIALDGTYTFSLPWETAVQLAYPADWNISEGSRLTLFSPDAYNFQISGSDNPMQDDSARQALENINQTAPIETREINGKTVYISSIRSGNGLAATVALNDGDYLVIQLLSRRGDPLDAMRPLLARLAASVQVVEPSDS